MPRIKVILFLLTFIFIFPSCIEPFSLDIGGGNSNEYSVNGQVTDQEGYQTVTISMTSSIDNPSYNPLSNCDVRIIDNNGDVFKLTEFEKGNYRVWMSKESLKNGNSYQLKIITESGIEIVSDFDKMPEAVEIDSVYYKREDIPTSNPQKPIQGIQFYIDVDGKNTNNYYYRWEITETWEHRAAYPKSWYWTGYATIKVDPPDFSRFFCWSTLNIKNTYNLTTKDLAQNKYRMYKLHFVDNQTQRLTYCYSVLVNQFAQSEPAYKYWENLRINSNDQGGLYNTQPIRIIGNLKSTSNPDLTILGFFGASSVSSKRIFARDIENIELYYPDCEPTEPEQFVDFRKGKPQYLYPAGSSLWIVGDGCVECNIFGGTTVKPSYWPY